MLWSLFAAAVVALGAGTPDAASTQAGQAQPDGWFPQRAREPAARDVATRLDRVAVGIEQPRLMPTALVAIDEMVLRIDTLGRAKLMAMAPRFERLKLPDIQQPHLDAMARLGMCVYYLEARYAAPGDADVDARLDAALGPIALALTTMSLRHAFLAGGGTDEQIKTYLAGQPLNQIAFVVQKDPELLAYTAGECRGVVSALLD